MNERTVDIDSVIKSLQQDIKDNSTVLNEILKGLNHRLLRPIEISAINEESQKLEQLATRRHKEIITKLNSIENKIDQVLFHIAENKLLTEDLKNIRSKVLNDIKLSPNDVKISSSSKVLGQGGMGIVFKGIIF